jgi:hypothetical protein
MHGQFGLNLKAGGNGGEALHKSASHNPIPRENVPRTISKNICHEACKQPIAEAMPRSICFIRGFLSDGAYHIDRLGQQYLYQIWGRGRIVCVVTVYYNVDVRFNVSEHPPHDIALAPTRFKSYDGAGGPGDLRGIVGGAVVIHEDSSVRKRTPKTLYNSLDSHFFVVAGNYDGNIG